MKAGPSLAGQLAAHRPTRSRGPLTDMRVALCRGRLRLQIFAGSGPMRRHREILRPPPRPVARAWNVREASLRKPPLLTGR